MGDTIPKRGLGGLRGQRPVFILALDASLSRCSAALLGDGELLAHLSRDGDRGHAAALPPMAAAVLAEAGLRAADLDAVAAVVGPGGFTGLRAALALAQGIALGAGLPVVGVATGEALAAALPPEQRAGRAVWAAVDNHRGRVVLERFAARGGPAAPPEVFPVDGLPPACGRVVVVGDAAEAVAERLAAHGVRFERLAVPARMTVEEFRIDSTR
ncbi:MAG: tRNA (adenosine(37)-N6)-threonylcarbamoyltransferase complex dimerization subunit type 1 TsaB, partial [Acetobacteraceae bacterium]|nr:tRNA (adenosine(37)-N6)-threonylcarbamoyltransferase complex dimerization subunit type 1 TsaB [Acetobacteraceae bacterium]